MAKGIFSRLAALFSPKKPKVEAPMFGGRTPADIHAHGWTWPEWRNEIQKNRIEGWSYCRFAQRHSDDSVSFVFGCVRGVFGIFERPFHVVHRVHGHGQLLLTTVTHLPSGIGIGTFDCMQHAAQACVAAEPICEDWFAFDPHNAGALMSAASRMHPAWRFTGLEVADDKYARFDSGSLGIWERNAHGIIQDRPEKLS